jgi:hypothetical protein
MTGAERVDRWRKRHAAKLARKAARRGGHTPMTMEAWDSLRPTTGDLQEWFVGPDEVIIPK